MAPRLQVESGLRPERLRPAATPVDPFVQPKDGYELAQLARGLQTLAPALGRFSDVLDQRSAEEQIAKGEQSARKIEEDRISYRDAVKKGLISASDNPWFLLGAKQQFGRAAAGQYARALQAAVATDEQMQASTNPEDFNRFESEFRQKWLDENVGDNRDLHFEKGFKIVDGYTMDEGRRFTAAAGARMEKRAGETLGVVIGQVLDQHYKEGADVASTLINAEMKAYLTDNPKAGRIANVRAVEAIADWARVNYKTVGRDDVEKLLRGVDGGPGSKLFSTHDAKEMVNAVEKEIISMRGAAMSLAHAEEVKAEQEAEKSFWSTINTTFVEGMKNGNLAGTDLTPYIAQLTKIDPSPDAPAKLFRLRESLLNAKSGGNDPAFREALMWVEGVSTTRPGQFLSMSKLSSYAAAEGLSGGQFNTVLNAIQERDRRAAEGAPNAGSRLLGDRMYAAGEQYIRGKMLDPWGTNSSMARSAAEEAVRDFGRDFLARHDEITKISDPAKQNQFIQDLAEQSFRAHASPQILKEHNKEGETATQNRTAESVFQIAVQNASESDLQGLGKAFSDYQAVLSGDRPKMSDETRALLTRLKVPLEEKALKLFFLEWDRTH